VIVVSDTTPLSELSKIGKLHLIYQVFGQILIPQEVYNEVTTGIHPAVAVVQAARWIEVRSVSNPKAILRLQQETELDLGECAAIILAEELGGDLLLVDDLAARKQAIARNLSIIGTVGTLLLAKQKGFIPTIQEVLDALIKQGKRISPKLYQEALTIAGET
jgi:predicted nucleic acid-binding protein